MSRRALVLRHHDEDHPGLIAEAFVAEGFDIDVVMVSEGSPTPVVDGYDVLVILGSSSAVYDEEVGRAWFAREREVIARAGVLGVPVLGICFGAQALCVFHGGVVARSPEPELGWYRVTPSPGVDFDPGPWFEYHFDRMTLPGNATLWATTPRAVQAFCVGRNVGVQFHPEIDEAQLRGWLETDAQGAREFGHDIEDLLAATAHEEPAARVRAQRLVGLFLRHAGQFAPAPAREVLQ